MRAWHHIDEQSFRGSIYLHDKSEMCEMCVRFLFAAVIIVIDRGTCMREAGSDVTATLELNVNKDDRCK